MRAWHVEATVEMILPDLATFQSPYFLHSHTSSSSSPSSTSDSTPINDQLLPGVVCCCCNLGLLGVRYELLEAVPLGLEWFLLFPYQDQTLGVPVGGTHVLLCKYENRSIGLHGQKE
ncbi:hypothetical protein DM860_016185 [Cuscuta australis]|uniref:Uncharacterized protein n=1 Tax=Cuscuta australis TaxID=267555 RepID=A0A328DQV5_9ASTE|nr:hypothetical protein DM860_016185 [Cuscuta australis]